MINDLSGIVGGGDTFLQLIQYKRNLPIAPFSGGAPLISVQRQIAGDRPQKDGETVGTLGRNRLPCAQISVIDTLLAVLMRRIL